MSSSSSNQKAAHPAKLYKTSEFIGIVLFIVSYTLQALFPWRVLDGRILLKIVGILLILAGAVMLRWTLVELDRFQQPRFPGIPTTRLVQSGPFRWSRNPTYAAIVLLIVPGVGLMLKNPWVLALEPVTALAFYFVLIRDEEVYLSREFPREWQVYCARTPRWI